MALFTQQTSIFGFFVAPSRRGFTAATGLFCRGGKIESRLLKFYQSHATPLSGMAKCDSAKFKQPAVTFCLLVKIVRPRQCLERTYHQQLLATLLKFGNFVAQTNLQDAVTLNEPANAAFYFQLMSTALLYPRKIPIFHSPRIPFPSIPRLCATLPNLVLFPPSRASVGWPSNIGGDRHRQTPAVIVKHQGDLAVGNDRLPVNTRGTPTTWWPLTHGPR